MTVSEGRFTESAMTDVMRAVAATLQVPADDATLLQLTNNAVFALPQPGIVIRIARSRRLLDRAAKTVRLGEWFDDIDAPTIRLSGDADQPIVIGDFVATVWDYLPTTKPRPTTTDLGATLREFHGLGRPPFDLPVWNPIGDARARIADAEQLASDDRNTLLAWCAALEPRITDVLDRAGGHLVHGDAHVGNLLRDRTSRVVLCDFDATCLGPWQVDLVAVPVGAERFRRRGDQNDLAASYGYDVTTDADWPTFRDARELKMVTSAVPLLGSSPGIAKEFSLRLNSIVEDDRGSVWTPFVDVS